MSFLDFFKGFVVTGKLPFKPKVTIQYPEEKRPKPERFHGRHVLNRYEDGMEKCIGCELCAGVCPARCIYVRGADNPPDAPVSPGERYGFVYEINFLRCIHCDMCVEACPTEAITESKMFEWSFVNREDAIYTKAELLVDDEGKPQELPWEDWKPGDDRNTSAWVRATAPSGAAAMEGEALWSGELGYGVRPAQRGQSDPTAADYRPIPTCHCGRWRPAPCGAIGVDGTRPVGRRRRRITGAGTSVPPDLLGSGHDLRPPSGPRRGVDRVPHRRRADPDRRVRRDPVAQPGPLRPDAGRDPLRGRAPVHRRVGRLPGRGPDHRLRRRRRHPVPVCHHVPGGRQTGAGRSRGDQGPATARRSCWAWWPWSRSSCCPGCRTGSSGYSGTAQSPGGFAGPLNGPGENVQKLGQSIYTRYLLPFEMTAALLRHRRGGGGGAVPPAGTGAGGDVARGTGRGRGSG